MPKQIHVCGSFACHGDPVPGTVRFTPSRLWVIEDGVPWACLAPTKELDSTGSFEAWLTPVDTDEIWWTYLAETPAGAFTITPVKKRRSYYFVDLIDEHRSRPGA